MDGTTFFRPRRRASSDLRGGLGQDPPNGKGFGRKIGATDIQVMKNQPGNHDVWLSGPAGIFIKVGYQGNLVVSGYTGCRLPR
jgi:Lipoprotein confined to pathogenic Mycobacterium